jgi:hypothetical protein
MRVAGGTSWHWPTVGQGTQQLRMAFDYYLLLPSKCRITQPRAHWDMQGHRTNIMSMDFIICASLSASRAALCERWREPAHHHHHRLPSNYTRCLVCRAVEPRADYLACAAPVVTPRKISAILASAHATALCTARLVCVSAGGSQDAVSFGTFNCGGPPRRGGVSDSRLI